MAGADASLMEKLMGYMDIRENEGKLALDKKLNQMIEGLRSGKKAPKGSAEEA